MLVVSGPWLQVTGGPTQLPQCRWEWLGWCQGRVWPLSWSGLGLAALGHAAVLDRVRETQEWPSVGEGAPVPHGSEGALTW